jgi:hypothetical protein
VGKNQLKKTELLCLLARGGMAEVHLARMTGIGQFEKLLVVKRILPQLARDPELVSMFLDEARIAASLHHLNTVQVFDVDVQSGQPYFSMEFLHGHDLRDLRTQAGSRLPLDQALAIVIAVCAGLHHAHERRSAAGAPLHLVHRDVSPHNVFVTFDGGVKLIDFGIAKAADRASTTQTGALKGKFSYMSPEQARCEKVDRRSDLFSVSILLYELTLGERLFVGNNEYELLQTVVDADVVPPTTRDPNYPAELERIVMKGLRREPRARYQTALELQQDLERFAHENRLVTTPSALADYMRASFADELVAWEAARAKGMTLAQHLMEVRAHAAARVATSEGPSHDRETEAMLPTQRRAPLVVMALLIVVAGATWIVRAIRAPMGASVHVAVPTPASTVVVSNPTALDASIATKVAAEPENDDTLSRHRAIRSGAGKASSTRQHTGAPDVQSSSDPDAPLPF